MPPRATVFLIAVYVPLPKMSIPKAKPEREIAQELGRRRAEIYAELQKLKAERDDLLPQEADYTAAQEKRRYATTFRARVDATRALNAPKP